MHAPSHISSVLFPYVFPCHHAVLRSLAQLLHAAPAPHERCSSQSLIVRLCVMHAQYFVPMKLHFLISMHDEQCFSGTVRRLASGQALGGVCTWRPAAHGETGKLMNFPVAVIRRRAV